MLTGDGPADPSRPGAPTGVGASVTLLVAGKITSNLLLVGLGVATARGLGPGGRGTLTLLLTVTTATTFVSSLGVGPALRVLHPKHPESGYLAAAARLGLPLLAFQTLLTAGAVAVLLEFVEIGELGLGTFTAIVLLGALSLLAHLLIDAALAVGRLRRLAASDVATSAVQLLLYIILSQLLRPTVAYAIVAYAVGYLVQAVLLGSALPRTELLTPPARSAWRGLVRAGRGPMSQSLAQFTTFKIDRVVLGVLRSPTQVGLYSVAATSAEILRLIPLGAGQVLLQRYAAGTITEEAARKLRRLVYLTMATGAVASGAFAPVVLRHVFGEGFRDASTLVPLLAAAEVALVGYQLDSHVLQGLGRFREAALPALAGVVLVLAFDLALIPLQGARGAALASLFTYLALSAGARRYLKLDPAR